MKNVRPLLLAALALGLGCACSRPPASDTKPPSEPGTAAMSPSDTKPVAPPIERGEPGTERLPAESDQGEQKQATGTAVYIVKDSGIRCIAPPCPSFNAVLADKPDMQPIPIHEVDLSAVSNEMTDQQQTLLHQKRGTGLRVEGTLTTRQNAGPAGAATVLKVERLPKQ